MCFIDKFKGFDEEILFNLGCRLKSVSMISGLCKEIGFSGRYVVTSIREDNIIRNIVSLA